MLLAETDIRKHNITAKIIHQEFIFSSVFSQANTRIK